MEFEPVIGLEVHAQLKTRSKLFCGCSTTFGASPNANTCPVCLGLPGALPVLNREAVAMAVKTALALDCRINQRSVFARKNYFYPDLPKGYQISQYDQPLAGRGNVTVLSGERLSTGKIANFKERNFGITRIHLEDDAGKSVHLPGQDSAINLNRSGVPLIEIVSEPDFRSSQEAFDFLTYLRKVLLYLDVCDGNMEEGSLRCDANVSVRPREAAAFGTKIEIKNLNSFRFLQKALDYEIERQIKVLKSGGELAQETRLWNEEEQKTFLMRSKEYAHDYRYFPDPDLLPVTVSNPWLKALERDIPELPEPRRRRLEKEYGLGVEEALSLTQSREFADYFEAAAAASSDSRGVYNWMFGDLMRLLKRDNRGLSDCPVKPESLAALVEMVGSAEISGKIAKDVFEKMYETGEVAGKIVASEGLTQISDEEQLSAAVDRILEANQPQVEAYRSGKTGLLGFFVGQVMQQTRGKANPQLVNKLLKERL